MSDSKSGFGVFFHYFAWTMSGLASVFLIFFLVGEGIPDILKGKSKELLPYLPFLIMAIGGCVLSFFKRKPGALLMIAGALAIDLILFLQGGKSNVRMMLVYAIPYAFPGLLLLLYKK